MKTELVTVIVAFLGTSVVQARSHRHRDVAHRRQVTTAPTLASHTTTSIGVSTPVPGVGSPPATGVTTLPAPGVATLPVTTLPATGVIPLAGITFGMPSQATLPVTATYSAGASPPISGAPSLPTPFVFSAANWPAQDHIPPTDSNEVKGWLRELEGFNIPNLAPTVDGSCINDTASAADAANRGWWTCGGYTRSTDIVACPTKYTWGVSFDDGPSPYTQTLLTYLTQKNISATFFVVGSRVIERPSLLVEEYMSGHEISVHTWSHKHLTSLTNEEIVAELGWTRHAIKTVLGVTPTTMRPPFGDIDDRVRAISLAMGLVPIMWTRAPDGTPFDTNDWKVAGGLVPGPQSFTTFQGILANASSLNTGFIVLQHDLFQITVDLAVGYTLNAALTHNPPFVLEPIGRCSNIPKTNLYLESNTNSSFPSRTGSKNAGFMSSIPTTLGIMILGGITVILV